MGKRREVAGGADGSLRRDDRVYSEAQQVADPIHQDGPAAGVAQGQCVGPQQQHRPDHVARQRIADADGVGDEQVLLEPGGVGRIDEGRGQVAEAGRHAVDDLPRRDQPLHDVTRLGHPAARVVAQPDPPPGSRHGLHVGDGEVRPGQDDLRLGGERLSEPLRLGQVPVRSEPRGRRSSDLGVSLTA